MAPSSGYHMVPKTVRAVKYAISRSSDFVRARLGGSGSAPSLEAVPFAYARVAASRHAIHPLALLRQSRSRFSSRQARLFSTAITTLGRLAGRTTTRAAVTFPASATRNALGRMTHTPFASPLRPNLTGGALPRSAGGYGLGGGGFGAARHFSHTGSAQAHVVQNVHAAVRAFALQGGRPLYDGTDARTGNMRFRAAGCAEAKAHEMLKTQKRRMPWDEMRGTSLDFPLAPAVTALAAEETGPTTLDEPRILPGLASDFARQLRELSAVYADLKKLRTLGALPISHPDSTTLRVRFDGCDAGAVLALCDELGITRGLVKEDPGWAADEEADGEIDAPRHDRDVKMALLFPWAPTEHIPSETSSFDDDYGGERYFATPPRRKRHFEAPNTALEWRSMLSGSARSDADQLTSSPPAAGSPSFAFVDDEVTASDPFEFESVGASSDEHDQATLQPVYAAATGYEGVEGIYRFLRELESAERRA